MVRKKITISLILLAACLGSIGCNPGIIDVPPPSLGDITPYFWKTPGAYQFEKTDAITATGLTQHTIIPLADGYSIKPEITLFTKQGQPLAFKHILAVSGLKIVAASETGLFYSADSGMSWSQVGTAYFNTADKINALCAIGDQVFAGTSHGILYFSTTSGASWNQMSIPKFSAPILALACDPLGQRVYVSIKDSVFSLSSNGGVRPTPFGSGIGRSFTSLAYTVNSQSFLLGGTDSSGLWYNLNDSDWVRSLAFQPTSRIRSVLATPGGYYCSTPSTIFASVDGFAWKPVSGFINGLLAYDAKSQSVIAANRNDSAIFISDNQLHQIGEARSIPDAAVNDVTASASNFLAATDNGIFRMQGAKGTWVPVFGNGGMVTDTIKSPGKFTMLHNFSGSVAGDSSWLACTLFHIPSTNPIVITARIIGHLDSLSAAGKTYSDVIAVRYANELAADKISTNIPHWIIYFARSEGAIIISQYIGDKLLTSAIRQ
ncbi:MAG: hypothetical protein ABI778_06670 [Ignavibacteriota bacterium]